MLKISRKYFDTALAALAALGFGMGFPRDRTARSEKPPPKCMGYCIIKDDGGLHDVLLMGPGGIKSPHYAMSQPHSGSDYVRHRALRTIMSVDFHYGEPDGVVYDSGKTTEKAFMSLREPVTLAEGDILVIRYGANWMYTPAQLSFCVKRTSFESRVTLGPGAGARASIIAQLGDRYVPPTTE